MTKIACILGLMGMLASLSPLTDIQNVEKKNVPIAGVISRRFHRTYGEHLATSFSDCGIRSE